MKHTTLLAVFSWALFMQLAMIPISQLKASPADTLRVVTFNLYGAPNSNWPTRQTMILDELEQIQPDLIALQEVVQTPTSGIGDDNRAKILADSLSYRTGFYYHFIYAYAHFAWDTYDEGIAILSRHLILDGEELVLPPGLFDRNALWCRVLTPVGIVNFFDTHLSYGNQEQVRIQQVQAIKDFIADKDADGVTAANLLCGDFNATPESPPIHLLTEPDESGTVYLDSWAATNPGQPGFTIPSDNPDARIDYIFLKDGQYGEILNTRLILNLPNKDDIFPSDHFGVYGEFETKIHKIDINIRNPLPGSIVSGQTEISWDYFPHLLPDSIIIYISKNGGKSWWVEWSGPGSTTQYLWDTQSVTDGTRYLLQIAALGDTSFGLAQSSSTFTVNNPGNTPPEIELQNPRDGERLNGIYPVKWRAADADGDSLLISLDVSTNDGHTWEPLLVNAQNNQLFYWNTKVAANSPNYRLRLRCNDGTVEVADTSGFFEISNARTLLPGSVITHLSGNSDAVINPVVVDSSQIKGHVYRITFNDSTGNQKTYDVSDVVTGEVVVNDATQLDGVTEGPLFDGFRLLINDFDPPLVNKDSTGWRIGASTLEISVFLPVINLNGTIYHGIPYPYDYRITLYDQIVDTTSDAFGQTPYTVKFKVENLTAARPAEILFSDVDGDHAFSRSDVLYIIERDTSGQPQFSWSISLNGLENDTPPQPGDVILVKTQKPLTGQDVYEFNSLVFLDDHQSQNLPGRMTLYQNYPNPFNPTTTIRYYLPKRENITLTIHNILGQKVRTLVENYQSAGMHSLIWDGANNNGQQASSGIYFYRLKTGNSVLIRKMIYLR